MTRDTWVRFAFCARMGAGFLLDAIKVLVCVIVGHHWRWIIERELEADWVEVVQYCDRCGLTHIGGAAPQRNFIDREQGDINNGVSCESITYT